MAQVVDTEQDIGPVRSPIDIASLNALFSLQSQPNDVHMGNSCAWSPLAPPLTIKQFKFGQSNPTYLLTDSTGKKAVLRKKPSANSKLISKTAHAIEREFHMLDAIGKTGANVPIALPYFLCEDENHIGTVFYVMEFVKGRIFHDPSLECVKDPKEKELIWKSIVETATAIHSIPSDRLFDALPEKHFRKPKSDAPGSLGYFARQVKSLSKIQELQAKTVNPIPHFEAISKWLLQNAPQDPPVSSIIHGDFKVDNLVLHPTEPRIIAVLDWELCTNGHPLFDLSNLLQPFMMPRDMNLIFSKFPIDQNEKLVSNVLENYKAVSNPTWDPMKLWTAGTVFGLYRVGVICQGIAQRVVMGVASSAEAQKTATLYPIVGEFAFSLIGKSQL